MQLMTVVRMDVEIAKLYSTVKSGSFINGTLDGIVNQLKKEGKLTKN